MITLGVAIATYNGASFIREQLASILAQRLRPDEIVISDDGSTDGTLAIARTVFADVADIRVVELPVAGGLGVTGNFARAIAATGTDVVVLCDQDDVWHPDRLAVARTAFERDPRLLLHHGNARLVDKSGDPIGLSLFDALAVTDDMISAVSSGGAFGLYLRRNIVTGAVTAFRRSLFDLASPLPDEWVHDEWLAAVAASVGSVTATREELIDYRQHGSNQIGIVRPTLRYRIKRMLTTEPSRNLTLAGRSRVLADRLAGLNGVPADVLSEARAKAKFEGTRAAIPAGRFARFGAIHRASADGGYGRYASQGRLDMVRDLVRRG